ncbi:hypothetical protein HanRHA438_Chr10g0470801 [Helianthus annuus]|nr:hypothetical protein HanRHA438_Chr10g0470801 [Helianthus annuus]
MLYKRHPCTTSTSHSVFDTILHSLATSQHLRTTIPPCRKDQSSPETIGVHQSRPKFATVSRHPLFRYIFQFPFFGVYKCVLTQLMLTMDG